MLISFASTSSIERIPFPVRCGLDEAHATNFLLSNSFADYRAALIPELGDRLRSNTEDRECRILYLALTSRLIPENGESVTHLAGRIGLTEFCQTHKEFLIRILSYGDSGYWIRYSTEFRQQSLAKTSGYQINWFGLCPSLISTPQLKRSVMKHKMIHERALASERDWNLVYESDRSVKIITSNFIDWIPAIRNQNRLSLRWGMTSFDHTSNSIGPGVRRHWFSAMSESLFSSGTDLFITNPEVPHYTTVASSNSLPDVSYKAVGRFLGYALLHGISFKTGFPLFFYTYLLERDITLSIIKEDEPDLYRQLKNVSKMEPGVLEAAQLELEFNGETHAITVENREGLIERKLKSLVSSQPFRYMKLGFIEVVPSRYTNKMVSPKDLRSMIEGESVIDPEDLIAHIDYDHGNEYCRWIIEFIRRFDQKQLSGFLRFVTRLSRLPLGGYSSLRNRITIIQLERTDGYPSASTCYGHIELKIPKLPKEDLEQALIRAIRKTGMPLA